MKTPATLFFLFLMPIFIFGQHGKIAKEVSELKKYKNPKAYFLFKKVHPANPHEQKMVANGLKRFHELLDRDSLQTDKILSEEPDFINVPLIIEGNNKSVILQKNKKNKETAIYISSGQSQIPKTISYSGAIDGDTNSVASFTFSGDEFMGLVSDRNGNYNIGKLDSSTAYLISSDTSLTGNNQYICDELLAPQDAPQELVSAKCVNWYWEVRYSIFQAKGSVANATFFIQGLFNQVQTLYANDGMSVNLKTLYIWTTPDPYTSTTSNGLLTQFGQLSPYIKGQPYPNRNFGDAATLIGTNPIAGIAWTAVLCSYNPVARMNYSGIYLTYNNVPNFSWSVLVLAHENAHNVGSPHTHECVWNGNATAIDGCYPNIGCPQLPLPTKGTIMSYCHLNVGIDFSLGFGAQPSALMNYYINNGACLTSCTTPPIYCTDTTEYRGQPCATGYTGLIYQHRHRDTTCTWSQWITDSSSCVLNPPPPPYPCPSPLVIVCSITQRLNDVFVNRSGYTNYKYAWKKNGISQSWTGQTVAKANYKIGDILQCVVTSTNAQTPTKCYIPCTCQITIN